MKTGCLLTGGGLSLGAFAVLVLVLLSAIFGAFSGNGSGPAGGAGCAPSASSAGASPADTSACLPSLPTLTAVAAQVVTLAHQMAEALYVSPDCHGQVSSPDCYNTWYKLVGSTYPPNASVFPQAALDYQNQICPGCAAFANGNFQCVSFVRDAYGPFYPMQWEANAFDLWALYQGKPGWLEIPAAAVSSPDQRSLPLPGDVMVFKDSGVGHVAIVMSVTPPSGAQAGAVTFANANSVSTYTTMPLLSDLTVDASSWPGYTVWGYLRPALSATPPAGRVVRINQLDPAQYASPADWQTWAYSACSAASMTEVLNAYGSHLRIQDVLDVESARGDITPQMGLVADSGIADTLGYFGLRTTWGDHWTLPQVLAAANSGLPVIVGWPPDRYAGGHIVVVTGGDLAGGIITLADSSSWDRTQVSVTQFMQWWAGFAAVATPA